MPCRKLNGKQVEYIIKMCLLYARVAVYEAIRSVSIGCLCHSTLVYTRIVVLRPNAKQRRFFRPMKIVHDSQFRALVQLDSLRKWKYDRWEIDDV